MTNKLKMHSPNLTQDNIARIRELFPGCVTESADDPQMTQIPADENPENHNLQISAQSVDKKIRLKVDFDLLRQELSEHIVEGPQERYHLNWPGKREALLTANAPIAKTLRPCREESVNFDTTKNLFIEGDNLDALKLLQETYLGKVKMIYIDPPYNTGNDFIYEDDFAEDSDKYLKRSNQTKEDSLRESADPKFLEVFFVDDNALAACFDAHSGIDESFVKELAKRQPLRVVFRDAGFKDSAVKINVEQIFKLLSPATEVKCI